MTLIHEVPLIEDSVHPRDQVDIQEQSVIRRDALTMPEVIYAIGQQMNPKTLLVCVLVSKTWRLILSPLLWSTITVQLPLQKTMNLKSRKTPSWAGSMILKHDASFLTCPNLTYFKFDQSGQRSLSAADFIHRHQQTLKSISLTVGGTKLEPDLVKALARCPNLERLELLDMTLDKSEQWMELYERVWSRCKIVILEGDWYFTNYQHSYVPPSKTTLAQLSARVGPARIQELSIRCNGEDYFDEEILLAHLWLLKQCPDLVRLEWLFVQSSSPIAIEPMAVLAEECRNWS